VWKLQGINKRLGYKLGGIRMCIVLSSEQDMCPYWVQEVLITHPFEKDYGNELGYAEVFVTVALVSGSQKSSLTVYHMGAVQDIQDGTEVFDREDNWWWALTRKFSDRGAQLRGKSIVLQHTLPKKERRWESLLRRYFNKSSIAEVDWKKLKIYRRQDAKDKLLPGVTTVWPHDKEFKDSEQLIQKAYGRIPLVRIEIGEIPAGTWLLRFSFVTSEGIYAMGPLDVVFPIIGPDKMIQEVCKEIDGTDNYEAIRLMNSQWQGLRLAQWTSQAQYDIAGLAPEQYDLSEERLMYPDKTNLLGLIDLNPTRSKYKRFAAYGMYPESGLLEAAFRVKPRCYLKKDNKGKPIIG
jgi:hypothetical protein